MLVGDIMSRKLVIVDPDTTVGEVQRLFEKHHFHHVLVVNHGHLVGVVSDRDLLKNLSPFVGHALAERSQDLELLRRRIHLVMTREPVSVTDEMPVGAAAWLMREKNVSCLPVVDEGFQPVGIVTGRDLFAALSRILSPGPGQTWTRQMPIIRLPKSKH